MAAALRYDVVGVIGSLNAIVARGGPPNLNLLDLSIIESVLGLARLL